MILGGQAIKARHMGGIGSYDLEKWIGEESPRISLGLVR